MALTDDQQFLAMTFVVIDFETLTPAGRPAEPIEVGAVAGRFTPDGHWRENGRYTALMRPPDDVQVTRFDVAQTGLTEQILRAQRPQAQVMAQLDGRLTVPPYRLVAHSAQTEAAVIGGQRQHCPTLAATPLLCTVNSPGLPIRRDEDGVDVDRAHPVVAEPVGEQRGVIAGAGTDL